MAIPFKKYGYTLNPITDEIETPQVFLVNKRLKKIGELYPVENLRITVNETNIPDNISFTYYKEINGEKSPYFNEIDDLSVIQVGGFGFFECSISKNQNTSVLKSVTAKSLGYAELSQTLHTLEVNTEDDMSRTDYDKDYPTIFYREIPTEADEETAKKLRESSLLHRILTETPHYKIGYVDHTLWYVQRTFSWSDKDIVSILNEVAEEITCIFDIQVRIGDNGEIERIVNAYDMQYCSHCWEEVKEYGETVTSSTSKFRNIVNGVCQNCGESKYVKDIGEDSGIYISTDNLSDDISINGDPDSIKNCLKITGGDDIMTATVQGLNMSASSKIMAFSDLQKKAMSPELRKKLDDYNRDYKDNIEDYEALLETEYNMQDIRLYLQSGKMPQIEKEIKTTDEALYSVLSNIEKYFKAKFFISSYENYYKYPTSSARTSISNMFTTFMPEGFSMTIDKSSNEEDTPGKDFDSNAIYGWYGTIKVYSTGNRDDSYTLHVTKNNGTYVTSGTSEEHYISSDTSIQSMVDNFRIQFYFADQTQEEYKEYLEQYTAYLFSTVDLSYENEQKKEWDKYGYNLLKSYADGYQKCIETIDDMLSTAEGETQKILNETREKYVSIQHDILLQMNVLEDQIFAVCRYLGGSYDDSYLNDNGEISYNYKYYKDDKKATIQEIFDHMVNPDYSGGYNESQTVYTPNEYIGDKPFQCLKCHSSNVAISTEGNVCRNDGCGAKGSDIYTYCDIMQNIADSYREHSNSGETIVELRTDYRNRFDTKNYLGDILYIELRSFIREDVYNNSNFTSDGLSNSQIIEQAKELKAKAEQELAKACNPQYSVTTSLSSVVAQKEFVYQGVTVNDDYSKFMINNYVRVLIDEVMYKMRLTSITFQFPVTDKIEVTFSNVTNCKTNTAMNVKEILDSAASMATSYDYVATQADKGAVANDQFVDIMNEGLNASLMAVKNSRDQDVVIDNHGILLRKKIHETDEYSPYQMKLINRNIVMTDDNWETAKLAIGLGLYEGVERYGVWADVICGNLLCGNKLAIYGGGDGTAENATVIIDGKGITLDGGKITWTKKLPTSSVDGLDDTVQNFVNAIDDLQSQIDGEITSWFEEYDPSPTNEPASTWTTDADKIKHEGDLFYNTATGAAYRYIYNSSTKKHEWSTVTDTTVAKALADAAKAQDTADGKRRVFVVQPTPPYDVGDLWTQGSGGDILKCKTAKSSGSYSADDWEMASKYTDDTAWKSWTSDTGEFGQYKSEIQNQIDGKSNCTYGGATPPSNPETGDLWFCTDSSKGYDANKAYMYNGTTWKESNGVPDSVWDIADGKSSIFVVKPNKVLSSVDSHFYYANDIWILESNMTLNGKSYKKGSIMTSTSDSTSFVENHWIEKVRYTDDTKAQEALEQAEKGIADAAQALIDAKTYANGLSSSYDKVGSADAVKTYVNGDFKTSIETAYKKYSDTVVSDFDKAVAEYLQVPGATTIIGGNHIISPYIEGGYSNITNGNKQVIIDPSNQTNTGYIFAVKNGTEFTVGIKADGTTNIKGGIVATSLDLSNCSNKVSTEYISGLSTVATSGKYSDLSGKPTIPTTVKDLGLDPTTLIYKGDITQEQKTDGNGNTYLLTTVPTSNGSISYSTYDVGEYVVFGREKGENFVLSKDGLLTAKNAVVYGTIYATDGEFTGKITSVNGSIGGWEINEKALKSEDDYYGTVSINPNLNDYGTMFGNLTFTRDSKSSKYKGIDKAIFNGDGWLYYEDGITSNPIYSLQIVKNHGFIFGRPNIIKQIRNGEKNIVSCVKENYITRVNGNGIYTPQVFSPVLNGENSKYFIDDVCMLRSPYDSMVRVAANEEVGFSIKTSPETFSAYVNYTYPIFLWQPSTGLWLLNSTYQKEPRYNLITSVYPGATPTKPNVSYYSFSSLQEFNITFSSDTVIICNPADCSISVVV